jgi:hypothetical protein
MMIDLNSPLSSSVSLLGQPRRQSRVLGDPPESSTERLSSRGQFVLPDLGQQRTFFRPCYLACGKTPLSPVAVSLAQH